MPEHGRIFRPLHEYDQRLAEYTREALKQCYELLQRPSPDTFLGRKTHEPFPTDEDQSGSASPPPDIGGKWRREAIALQWTP